MADQFAVPIRLQPDSIEFTAMVEVISDSLDMPEKGLRGMRPARNWSPIEFPVNIDLQLRWSCEKVLDGRSCVSLLKPEYVGSRGIAKEFQSAIAAPVWRWAKT